MLFFFMDWPLPHDGIDFLTELKQRFDFIAPLECTVMIGQLINQFLSLADQQVDPLQRWNQILFRSHSAITRKNEIRTRSQSWHVDVDCGLTAGAEI